MSSGPSQHDLEAPPGFSRGEIAFLLGVTVLAAALRLFRLGDWSFWVDEAHTFRDITSDHDAFWSSRVARYPLSFVMLHICSRTRYLPPPAPGGRR